MLAPHQSHFHTLLHDLFEQLLEQFRFLKPPMPVFREGGVMRNLLIETEARKPAPRQMHAQFLPANAHRQPNSSVSHGTRSGARIAPAFDPELKTPEANARSRFGNHSATVSMV